MSHSKLHSTTSRKMDDFSRLSRLILKPPSTDTSSVLFGYLLGHLNLKTHSQLAMQLKTQFSIMKTNITIDHTLQNEDAILLIYDMVEGIRTNQQGNEKIEWRPENLTLSLYENMNGLIGNKRFIIERWEKEASVEKEHEMTEKYIKEMLEMEKSDRMKKTAQQEAEGWECPICICEIDPAFMGILQCGHIFHPECLNSYLQAQIQGNELDIKCPQQTCSKAMPINDINTYIDGPLRQKYQKFTFNRYVQTNTTNMSWCPTAGCSAAFEFDLALDNYRCPACSKHYCLKCRCQFHTNMTCAEYRVSSSFDKNDEQFIDFVKGAKFKQCPKCSFWVERNKGCSTMKCKCGQEFCYDCGGTGCPHGKCSNSAAGKVIKGVIGLFK